MATANEYMDYLLNNTENTVNVLHLEDIEHLVNYMDVNIWLDKLAEVAENWIIPLIRMADNNNIRTFLYPCNGRYYRFSKYDSLKFWRQQKLEKHVHSY